MDSKADEQMFTQVKLNIDVRPYKFILEIISKQNKR
jgi:hypothetical protein